MKPGSKRFVRRMIQQRQGPTPVRYKDSRLPQSCLCLAHSQSEAWNQADTEPSVMNLRYLVMEYGFYHEAECPGVAQDSVLWLQYLQACPDLVAKRHIKTFTVLCITCNKMCRVHCIERNVS